MTRRVLLGSGATPADAVPDPLPGTDPEPSPVWPGWPTTDDPILLTLRPHGRRTGFGSIRLPSATDTDHNAAAIRARNESETEGGRGVLYWDYGGPDYRSDVIFGPGIHEGAMGGGSWSCYVGSTGDPADVILQADGGSNGTIHSYGTQYLEGLTVRAYTTDGDLSPKYPWHITGGLAVAANCIFDASDSIAGVSEQGGNRTQAVIGKDSSVVTLFYKCKFIADPTKGNGFMNMHGTPQPGQDPEIIVFIDCETVGLEGIGGTGNRDADGNPSRVFVIGLTHDEHLASIGGDVNTEVHTDSDLPVIGNPPAVYRNVTEWPAMIDGLPDNLRAHYYPSLIGSEPSTTTPPVTDAAPMAPVAGRTYYTRVRTPEAMRVTKAGFTCTTAAGQYAGYHTPADTPYIRDEPLVIAPVTPHVALTAGENSWDHYYAYTRYPGDNGIWVWCAFDNAAARVIGSAELAGITDCAYTDDGVTLVPVAEGTPHPVPFIRANV